MLRYLQSYALSLPLSFTTASLKKSGRMNNFLTSSLKEKDNMSIHTIAKDLCDLIQKKNQAYGNAFDKTEDILKILYPDGIQPNQYKDVHVLVRMLDKMSRIAKDNDPFGESPYQDLAGYALLSLQRLEQEKEEIVYKTPK